MNLSNFKEMKMQQFGVMLQSPGQGECNWTGRCPFFKNLQMFRKKIAFQYPVSELLN